MSETDRRKRRGLALALALLTALLGLLGLAVGSNGWAWPAATPLDAATTLILTEIRAPRSLGAWLVGALLGLAGALAQGLFRNPLADPYLLGSASGASLAVVAVLAAGVSWPMAPAVLESLAGLSLVSAAFAGAMLGMGLTLALAAGAGHTPRLLLAGVVVGVMLTAINDLVVTLVPQALQGRQGFMLGQTALLSWQSVGWLGPGALVALLVARSLARALDALSLGEDSATSLGLALPRLRAALVVVLAWSTGLAVSQAGLVAFVGLLAPHLVRRFAPAPHGFTVLASAAAGGVLLLGADVLSRALIAPQELPVGLVTAVLGGGYLLWLLRRQGRR